MCNASITHTFIVRTQHPLARGRVNQRAVLRANRDVAVLARSAAKEPVPVRICVSTVCHEAAAGLAAPVARMLLGTVAEARAAVNAPPGLAPATTVEPVAVGFAGVVVPQ
jgi:hypothetical protein